MSQGRVLVVDDDPEILRILTPALQAESFDLLGLPFASSEAKQDLFLGDLLRNTDQRGFRACGARIDYMLRKRFTRRVWSSYRASMRSKTARRCAGGIFCSASCNSASSSSCQLTKLLSIPNFCW